MSSRGDATATAEQMRDLIAQGNAALAAWPNPNPRGTAADHEAHARWGEAAAAMIGSVYGERAQVRHATTGLEAGLKQTGFARRAMLVAQVRHLEELVGNNA